MRDFKFREWNTRNNKMTYFGLFDTDEGYHILEGRHIIEEDVMQYTGLKDKNGREIYEGDIIEYCYLGDGSPENTDTGEIYWDLVEGAWKIRWSDKNETLAHIVINYSTLLGNKFENPELMEDFK